MSIGYYMMGLGFGFSLGVAISGGDDVGVNIAPQTKDMAKYGMVTADQACAAHEEFSTNLNDYFKAKARGGKVNPTLTITKADCMKIMAEKVAAPVPGQ